MRVAPRFCCILPILLGCKISSEPKAAHAPADSAAGEVAFRYAGDTEAAIVVPVHVNGQGPFDFVLDTGATLTCVDQQLRNRLQLPERPGLGFGAGVGGSGRLELADIDSLRIGAAMVIDLPVCVLNLVEFRQIGIDIEGLVGLNLLKQFDISLEFDRRVLTLQSAAASDRDQ